MNIEGGEAARKRLRGYLDARNESQVHREAMRELVRRAMAQASKQAEVADERR